MLTIFFSDQWLQAIESKSNYIRNIRIGLLALSNFELNITKAESAQRGFLIANLEVYMNPYAQTIVESKSNLLQVKKMVEQLDKTKRTVEEERLLNELELSLESKTTEMNLTLQFARDGKFDEAKKIMLLESGLLKMEKINTIAGTLKASLNEQIDVAIKELERIRAIARFFLILGPLVLIFLVVLVIKQLLQELAEKALFHQRLQDENVKHEIKVQEQSQLLRSLSLEYQTDVERQRNKLAREIHDELGSILTATKMDISWVIKAVKSTHPEVVDKLKKTNVYLDQGINFKRQIVQELHPSMISSFGFWPAFRTLIEDAADRNQWKLTMVLPDESTKVNETISLVAYRITQETLNNANKYAKATEMSIYLICDDKYLKIEIQDNGIGIDIPSLDQTTHGLSGMRNRVHAIGGHFEVISELGKGVLTRVMLPLDIKGPA